jgi:hypothetical protein
MFESAACYECILRSFKPHMHEGQSCGSTALNNPGFPLHPFATPFFFSLGVRRPGALVTLADDRRGL